MQERTKAQITIGLLTFFASVWVLLIKLAATIEGLYFILGSLIVLIILSYVLIGILEWIGIFDLKTNSIITLIVLSTFMITLIIYIFFR